MINFRTQRLACLLFVFILVSCAQVSAQIISNNLSSSATGFVYTHWTLKNSSNEKISLNQFWVPLSGYVAIQENIEVRYYLAGSSNNLELGKGKGETYLGGVGDARIELSRTFARDRVIVSGGINLPLGKTELGINEERAIIEMLSQNFLEFPMRSFGQGLGLRLTVGAANNISENTVLGVGVGFEYIGPYNPYFGIGEYDPGDVFSADFGITNRSKTTAYSFAMNYSLFMDDNLDKNKVFKQGQQLGMRARGVYDDDRYRVSGGAGYLFRGRNTRYDLQASSIVDRLKLYGNELVFSFEFGRYLPGGWRFSPLFSLLLIAGNEENLGESRVFTSGGSINKIFSKRYRASFWFKFMTGDADGKTIELSGYQLSTSLSAAI